jgi:hypothetical protein
MADSRDQEMVLCHDDLLINFILKRWLGKLPMKRRCYVTILPKGEMLRNSNEEFAVFDTKPCYDVSAYTERKSADKARSKLLSSVRDVSGKVLFWWSYVLLLSDGTDTSWFCSGLWWLAILTFSITGFSCLYTRFILDRCDELLELENTEIKSGVNLLRQLASDCRQVMTVPLESAVYGMGHKDKSVRQFSVDVLLQLPADFRSAIIEEYGEYMPTEELREISHDAVIVVADNNRKPKEWPELLFSKDWNEILFNKFCPTLSAV